MTRLIVNADDLGSGPGRDRGIFAAFTGGIVSSASLLANGPTFAAAARQARSLGLPLGVHLNLSEGRALSGPVRGLTDATGSFPGKAEARRLLAGGAEPEDVRRELFAQVEAVFAAGLAPDHLDTHQHAFLFPTVTAAVIAVAKDCGIRALRLPQPAEPARDDPGGPLGEELARYRHLAPAARRAVAAAGLSAPEGLWGMPLLDRLDQRALEGLLHGLPTGTWELMVHPGFPDPGDPFGGAERQRETTALTSAAIRRLLTERGIHLCTFGDLSCAS